MMGAAGSTPMSTEPEPMRDCTKVAWDNPGQVADPKIAPIAADAGTTKMPFEQNAGMEEVVKEANDAPIPK